MNSSLRIALSFLLLFLAACPADPTDPGVDPVDAGTLPDGGELPDGSTPTDGLCATPDECAAAEQRASDKLAAVASDAEDLAAFIVKVPKGGDLHMHLSGSVYAETYMDWARTEGGFCIKSSDLSLSRSCGTGTVSVPEPTMDLFMDVVRAWSMEGFVPGGVTGHDHFFSTFSKFGAISGKAYHAKGLADVMTRADQENEIYLEPMLFSNSTAGSVGKSVWTAKHGTATMKDTDFDTFYNELLADSGWDNAVQAIIDDVEASETGARDILACGSASPSSACRVGTRFAVYISRGGKHQEVFAQMVAAYEAAMRDGRVVAVNLVGPEDGTGALNNYDRQMAMLGFMQSTYDSVSPLKVTLHAGELAAKYMPAGYVIENIGHIRKAVETAGAQRIGHGLDVLHENGSQELLTTMRDRKVLVEVCLSSNDQILEVRGSAHPLASYLSAGVPVALATDDQAISRSSIAKEYTKAVQDHALSYGQLKTMARNSLEYSFLPGDSLWVSMDSEMPVSPCAPPQTAVVGAGTPSEACSLFLAASPKAERQWELEKRFRQFESAQ